MSEQRPDENSVAETAEDTPLRTCLQAWYDERARYPTRLLVGLKQPLRKGTPVFVSTFPALDARDEMERYLEPRYRLGYEVPRALLNERLTESTAPHLETALSIISAIKGVSYQEGLAFLTQLFILMFDLLQCLSGEHSMLSGPTYGDLSKDDRERQIQINILMNDPVLTVTEMLDFWNRFGGRLASVYGTSPADETGRPCYFVVPPAWLTSEELRQAYGEQPQPPKVPVIVDADLAPVAGRFVNFYREHVRAGGSPSISFDVRERERRWEAHPYVFRLEGRVWTVSFEGRTVRVNDMKGLRYLARLLERPGQEVPALRLVEEVDGPTSADALPKIAAKQLAQLGLRPATLGGGHVTADSQALAEYKRALQDYRKDLADAEELNDPERAAQARKAVEQLEHELARAYGLHGRSRSLGSSPERARKAVSIAIARGVAAIASDHPALGLHLSNSVKRGNYFSYQPETAITWQT
jgi:hypothetical protein